MKILKTLRQKIVVSLKRFINYLEKQKERKLFHDRHEHLDLSEYYQAMCEDCKWRGCSCQLKIEGFSYDSDIYCPVCDSGNITS